MDALGGPYCYAFVSGPSCTLSNVITLSTWGNEPGENNAVAKIRVAMVRDQNPPLFLTAACDPADTTKVLLSAWNTTGGRVGKTQLVMPTGSVAGDASLYSFSYSRGRAWVARADSATWYGFPLTTACQASFPFPTPQDAKPWVCSNSNVHGSTCRAPCGDDYAGAGYQTSCNQGTWQPVTGACQPKGACTRGECMLCSSCRYVHALCSRVLHLRCLCCCSGPTRRRTACTPPPNFDVPDGALPWACIPTPSGDSCTTACEAGFEGPGFTSKCELGKWQPLTGSCEPKGWLRATGARRAACCCCIRTHGPHAAAPSHADYAAALPAACVHHCALLAAACPPLTLPVPANTTGWPSTCCTVPSLPSDTNCEAPCSGGLDGGVTATCDRGSWNVTGSCGEGCHMFRLAITLAASRSPCC